jgi:two-component system cell cycle sensor histidine kinase/response regulator CckA
MSHTQSHKVAVYSLASETASKETLSDIHSPLGPGPHDIKNNQLARLVEQMPALLWTTDLDLNMIQVEGNGLGHLKRSPRSIPGMPLAEFFEQEAANFPVLAAHCSALGGLAQAFEFTLDNTTFWGIAEPLFNTTWNLIGTIGVAVDISLRKNAEEMRLQLELRQREADKHQSLVRLAGGMAHHFNNLLTGILGYTSLAQGDLAADHPVQGLLKEIENVTTCAAGLTDQLLCFGQRQLRKPVPVNLTSLIREQFASLQVMLGKTITLRCDLMDDLPLLAGDPDQLARMVASLLSQAAESIGAGEGIVMLRTQVVNGPLVFDEPSSRTLPEGEYIWLQVSDTGSGLAEETKARIFEPFPRGIDSGRDLGLATALGVVHGHLGALTVSSKPGLGTTCHVLIPVLHTSAEAAGPEAFI